MKRISTVIAIALLVCTFSAASASAKVTSRVYTFGQDFIVGGTTVKAGTYRFSFDGEKNELTVADRKTKEVIARTEARVEDAGKGPSFAGIQLAGESAPLSVAALSFDGQHVVRVSASAAQGK